MPTKKKSKKPTGKIAAARKRIADLRERRPHKSFQLTKRRDIPKRPKLPGYFSFTKSVFATLAKYKKPFGILLWLYVVAALLIVGFAGQNQYQTVLEALNGLGEEVLGGQLDIITQTTGLFGLAISGGLNANLNEVQQLLLGLLGFMGWLTGVWLLRQLFADSAVRVRDALYNAMAPVISTLLIVGLVLLQLVPAILGIVMFSVATQSSDLSGAVSMMFGVIALLLMLLSLYWVTSSFFALIIVTLPGTYPMTAIRAAGDIAIGRRLSLMLRLLWLGLLLFLVWLVILIPILLLDNALQMAWLPIVPVTTQILTGFSLFFAITYVYLLYRGMINEPSK